MSRWLALGTLTLALPITAAEPLPHLIGDPQQTSVSGLSSGAYMAVQYEVAFSASVTGAGIVAGGPYYCAAGSIFLAKICMGLEPGAAPDASVMVAAARKYAAAGTIDALDHLKTHRIYIYTGTNDQIVKRPAVDALVSFYQQLSAGDGALMYVTDVPSGHAMITPDFGNECASSNPPGIVHCTVNGVGYDQAGVILQHIYGTLKPPATELSAQVVAFDQQEFAAQAKMAGQGYVYVPKACAAGAPCNVHIALHGCIQSAKTVGDRFYLHVGYNRWADTNHLVVLYPQVDASLMNPQGCWDWFGYTGADYAIKTGPQLAAIKAMVDRLVGAH